MVNSTKCVDRDEKDSGVPPITLESAPAQSMTSLCEKCVALCCRYFALPLDNPEDAEDYDNIRWYLMHESVVVFIEKDQWYLAVLTRCKHLQPDNRCGIYERRPRICRKYTTDNCEYHGAEYDYEQLFTSSEQLLEYAEKTLGRPIVVSPKPTARLGMKRLPLPVV